MEKIIKEKVWFCDVCGGKGGCHSKCEICEKEFCCICEFIGYNPTHIQICKEHKKDEVLKDTIRSFEDKYNKLDEEIKKTIKNKQILNELEKENNKND